MSICRLQRHIGLDSLSLVSRGTTVVGLDFSGESLRIARELSARTGLSADFVQADVLDAADALATTFDLVFTSRGVLMWVSDLDRWAENGVELLHPGGVFYLLGIHPLAMVLNPTEQGLTVASSYFGDSQPTITEADASYAVSNVELVNQETREWIHPVGDVVTALGTAGLVIDFLHEHPNDGSTPTISSSSDGVMVPQLPGLYSVRGHRSS